MKKIRDKKPIIKAMYDVGVCFDKKEQPKRIGRQNQRKLLFFLTATKKIQTLKIFKINVW